MNEKNEKLLEKQKDLNGKLLEAQKEWEEKCYKVLKEEYDKDESRGRLSCAFSFGLSYNYVSSKKKVMVVGQEANGHTFDYDTWGLANWQKWAIDYLDFQINKDDDEKRKSMNFRTNNSPFWKFMRGLKKNEEQKEDEGYGICWNNLDKVRRYILFDEKEWTEDYLPYDKKKNRERAILDEKIFEGKSLLQKEIEIVEPNFVIFAVGPRNPYYHTLCNAFFDGEDAYKKLLDSYPNYTENEGIVEISEKLGLEMPAYYIYHPSFFQRKGALKAVIAKLKNEMETKE